jgi:hypothetical protein
VTERFLAAADMTRTFEAGARKEALRKGCNDLSIIQRSSKTCVEWLQADIDCCYVTAPTLAEMQNQNKSNQILKLFIRLSYYILLSIGGLSVPVPTLV